MRLLLALLCCALGCVVLVWSLRTAETAGEAGSTENSTSGRESSGEGPVDLVAPATGSTPARNASEETPGDPAAPQEDLAAPEEDSATQPESTWAEKYRGWSAKEMVEQSRALSVQVGNRVADITPGMYKRGEGVFWLASGRFSSKMGHTTELRSFITEGVDTHEVVLPRDEYPELYALKAESEWLAKAATDG